MGKQDLKKIFLNHDLCFRNYSDDNKISEDYLLRLDHFGQIYCKKEVPHLSEA